MTRITGNFGVRRAAPLLFRHEICLGLGTWDLGFDRQDLELGIWSVRSDNEP